MEQYKITAFINTFINIYQKELNNFNETTFTNIY